MRHLLLLLLLLVRVHAIDPLPTDQVLLIGRFANGPVEQPVAVDATAFDLWFASSDPAAWPAEIQARQFFRNGGTQLEVVRIDPSLPLTDALTGRFDPPALRGCGWALPFSDLGILLVPELADLPTTPRNDLLTHLRELADGRHFILLLDPPTDVDTAAEATTWAAGLPQDLDFVGALYPHVLVDPGNGTPVATGASGSVAPVVLRKDASAGVWKAAAGTDAAILVEGLSPELSTNDASTLNAANLCIIRHFTGYGTVLWGWRSRDTLHSDNLYFSVARLRRWLTHSLRRRLAGPAALQPGDGTLWTSLQSQCAGFLDDRFRDGAFAGVASNDAYFARCDATTTTDEDVAQHRANLLFGIAPVRPSEFQFVTIPFDTQDADRPVPTGSLILTLPPTGGWRVFHSTAPGFTHRVQDSATLAPASWIDHSNIPGDSGWHRLSGPTLPAPRFFRLATD